MRFFLLLVTVAYAQPLNAQDQSKQINPPIEAIARAISPEQMDVGLPKLDSFERVVARLTTSPDRERGFHDGNVNEYALKDVSVDGYVFGVRAVGREAPVSLVGAHVNPPRGETLNKVAPQ